jgi:hypothetical protein
MTNSKILEYGEGERTRLLTEIERQTLFCLKVALTPVPCPACHEPTSQVDALQASPGRDRPVHGERPEISVAARRADSSMTK